MNGKGNRPKTGGRRKKTGDERRVRRESQTQDLKALEARVQAEAPKRGSVPGQDEAAGPSTDGGPRLTAKLFEQLPLSKATLSGLHHSGFLFLTEIQRASLPHALAGRDILASARTGSGKTLAFVVTALESLHRRGWSPRLDGVGALILTPTRELALQIFNVLRQVGRAHPFSAGLVVGGKSLEEEQARIRHMNILVATPGRLLQHLEQTADFHLDGLRLLVLDEADRLLDLGFQKALDDVLRFCPSERQTMLFSATLSRTVQQLSRVSLHEPEHLFVHEDMPSGDKLAQSVVVGRQEDKLNMLWSFIASHPKAKMLVFLSSCKQVRFVYEAFRLLRCGVPVFQLHGKMSQMSRMAVYASFSEKTASCLFATDVAARGLDFPGVQWVLQIDCPDDVDSYVHRAGRTARHDALGHALLYLTPAEAPFLEKLALRGIRPTPLQLNPDKQKKITEGLLAVNSEYPEIKYLAQKAFVSYLRSVFLRSGREERAVEAIDADAFARSLGLVGAPKIKFVAGSGHDTKNLPYDQQRLADAFAGDRLVRRGDRSEKSAIEKLVHRKNANVLSEAYEKLRELPVDKDGEEDLLRPKMAPSLAKRTVFSEDDLDELAAVDSAAKSEVLDDAGLMEAERLDYHRRVAERLAKADEADKAYRRNFRKELRRQKRRERIEAESAESGAPSLAVLAVDDDREPLDEPVEESADSLHLEDLARSVLGKRRRIF